MISVVEPGHILSLVTEFLKAAHWPNSVFKVVDFGRVNKMILNIEMN